MVCSRILLENCDETFSKRRHNRKNDTEVSWKAATTVTFFRFFESSDKRHSYIERAGQIFRLRYTFTRKKGSEIWIHSEALLWEFSFIKDLVNCRYEEISTAVSVEAVRSDTLFSYMYLWCLYGDVPSLPADYSNLSESEHRWYSLNSTQSDFLVRHCETEETHQGCSVCCWAYSRENRWPVCC